MICSGSTLTQPSNERAYALSFSASAAALAMMATRPTTITAATIGATIPSPASALPPLPLRPEGEPRRDGNEGALNCAGEGDGRDEEGGGEPRQPLDDPRTGGADVPDAPGGDPRNVPALAMGRGALGDGALPEKDALDRGAQLRAGGERSM